MRKIQLWKVDFLPIGVLDGTVNVAADKAEDAIKIAEGAVEEEAPGQFTLMAIAAVKERPRYEEGGVGVMRILWVDDSKEAKPHDIKGVRETVAGKTYQAVAALPREEDTQLDSASTVEADKPELERMPAVENEAEKEGRKIVKDAIEASTAEERKDFAACVDDHGNLIPKAVMTYEAKWGMFVPPKPKE